MKNSDEIDLNIKISFAVFLVVLLILAMVHIFESSYDANIWNNGYHALDGGKWEYQQMIGHRYSTCYAYKCTECGKIVELSEYYQEGE